MSVVCFVPPATVGKFSRVRVRKHSLQLPHKVDSIVTCKAQRPQKTNKGFGGGKVKGSPRPPADEATSSNSAPDLSATEASLPSSIATGIDSSTPVAANGKAIGWSFLPQEEAERAEPELSTSSAEQEMGEEEAYQPHVDLLASSADEGIPLPTVSRGQIFGSCFQVCGLLGLFGLGLRLYAHGSIGALGNDPATVERLLSFPSELNLAHGGVAILAAASVTAARQALLQVWPSFAAASNRSNQQILAPLQWYDLIWVAALPGISEELLFRGALIPAVLPDWRGALLAGAAFGVLHNNGGRNWSFALWASAVGVLYGAAFLATEDVTVPMAAHSLANLASAVIWRRQALPETKA